MYKIPLFDLNFDDNEEQAVLQVLRSKWISSGPKTAEFESKFADLLDVKYTTALSNCTVALHLAMKLLEVGEGDEVICPSLTFVATCNAIRYVNAIPVFADMKSLADITIDPDDIERKITKKTKAIVVMHYGGFACDMDRIMALAGKYNLKVIEDACHGPLSEYKGKRLGTIGHIGCFSFFSNKNISCGEGGMIVTNDRSYSEKLKLLRSHGMTSLSYDRATGHSTSYDVVELGFNYRIDDIRSAIGLVQLDKLPSDLERRAKVREHYIKELSEIEEIIIPFKTYKEFASNYIFPIVLKSGNGRTRDNIRTRLAEAGIQTSVHYPAVHHFSIYKDFNTNLPVTDFLTDHLITLPMYSKITNADITYIVDRLKCAIKDE